MPKFDGYPYTQLTTPARDDLQGILKDVSEANPALQTKYALLEDLLKFGSWASKVRTVTASGTVTLVDTDPIFIEIDPNGSDRDVSFPAKSDNNHGYYVRHVGSANTLTLKRSGGATITTLTTGEAKYVMPSTISDFASLAGSSAAGADTSEYQISATVSSNNLIVALKNKDGNDPSSGTPVKQKIGGTIRTISAALSLQVNAGASVFNLGHANFAGLPNQLFVYLIYRVASSTVQIGLSRMCHGKTYADFSSTSTDEKYLAYSGSAPASTDAVELIGRIDVQNSGTASYNWSIPSGAVTIHKPIFETSWLTWTPTFTGFSSAPTNLGHAYKIRGDHIYCKMRQSSNGTSTANYFTISYPFASKNITNVAYDGMGTGIDNNVAKTTPIRILVNSGAGVFDVYSDMTTATGWTASGGKRIGTAFIDYPIG